MKIIFLFIVITLIPLILQKEFLTFSYKYKLNSFASGLDLETIRKNILKNHNYHRNQHKVGDLKRNSELEKIAQEYSEKLASTNTFEHSGNTYKGKPLGENLYAGWGVKITGTEASDAWYDEIKKYNFKKQGFSSETGHFTQLIWKGTSEIGCGAACEEMCAITCNYFPAGNVIGEFESNVFKKGMSTAAKFFLTIFILLLVALAIFAIYHFFYKKRSFSEIKDYFKCCAKK